MNINNVLKTLAELLDKNRQKIIDVNQEDFNAYEGSDKAMLDRLKVDNNKISGMIEAVNTAMKLEDPAGKVLYTYIHENGLKIENKTVPFGKILIIYESRPDVTIEAAVTAFKAGNKVLLKGGREARKTNLALVDIWQEALKANAMAEDFVAYLDYERAETQNLIKENSQKVDLIIPRGGEGLIKFVTENASVPVIVSGRGNNFLYVDKEADAEMAIDLILNGKQRISVCNALDKVLIHQDIPDIKKFVEDLVEKLKTMNIEIWGDKNICVLNENIKEIENNEIFAQEFLSAKILLAVVFDLDEAISKTNKYSGGHSACVVTEDDQIAKKFQDEVDCAAVHHNSSVRFTDGGQFGFGTEIAISTQKLHFRGPISVNQLVTNKWYVNGNGQIRN